MLVRFIVRTKFGDNMVGDLVVPCDTEQALMAAGRQHFEIRQERYHERFGDGCAYRVQQFNHRTKAVMRELDIVLPRPVPEESLKTRDGFTRP